MAIFLLPVARLRADFFAIPNKIPTKLIMVMPLGEHLVREQVVILKKIH